MIKQKKAQIKKAAAWIALAAVVTVLTLMPMLAENGEQEQAHQASILSDTAQRRTLETSILGGGILTAEDTVQITVPAQVKLAEYMVNNGDTVSEGDPIAKVDRVSVMYAISQMQETMDTLKAEIEDASDSQNTGTVKSSVSGTVKQVFAQAGEDVQSVMLRDGALAVLSLDDRMAVTVERNTALTGGDVVCVALSDGTEVEGRVESNLDGILVVTVADEGYQAGEQVSLTTEDGDRIGVGELYIHAPWNVISYSGSVERVNIREGDTVYSGKILFELENTGIAASHQLLVNKHMEYEELMLELFRMYQTETIAAPCDGVVTGVDEAAAYMLSDADGWQLELLSNAPGGDDETGYINYVGQVKEVGIDGLILRLNPQAVFVEDYKDLSGVDLDVSLMTQEVVHTLTVPVYMMEAGEWVQMEPDALAPGDILLFAGDETGTMVWAVLVSRGETEPLPEETQPSEPEQEPMEPSAPEQPEDTEEAENPEKETKPSGSGQQLPQGGMSGSYSGAMDGTAEEQEEQYYDLSVVTVAGVIPQGEVTVTVTIDEQDVGSVKLGMEAEVTVNALSGEAFTGTVTQIGSEGTNGGGSSKFTVTVSLSRSEGMLGGMSASVKLPLEQRENVLTVPVEALTESQGAVWVYTNYSQEEASLMDPVQVTTGLSDGAYVQILSGLQEGQQIRYAYYDTLAISNTPEAGGFPFG